MSSIKKNRNGNRTQRHLDALEVLNFDELMSGLYAEMEDLRYSMRNPEKHFHAIKRYLQCGADPNFRSNNNHLTPFQFSVIFKTSIRSKLVKMFLEYGADPNIPLSDEYSNSSIIEFATLLNPQMKFSYNPNSDLRMESELIEMIIKAGGSVTTVKNSDGLYDIYPLFELEYRRAIVWGDPIRSKIDNLIGIFIKNGAHLVRGDWTIFEWVLECTRDISIEYYDPMDIVLESMREMDRLELLNATNISGWTPLHAAIAAKDTARVLKFLKYGADPNISHGDKPDAFTYAKDIYKDEIPPELELIR